MKVEIINSVNGREFRGVFESEELLDSWVAKQLGKGMRCPWGKPDHHVTLTKKLGPESRAKFVEDVVIDDVVKYKYFVPCEYEIHKDVTPLNKAPKYFRELRSARSKKISEHDWTQLADAPISSDERVKYREYRQYLRDLPTQYSDQSVHSWTIMEFSDWMVSKGYN